MKKAIAVLCVAFAGVAHAAGTGPFEVNAYGSFAHMTHTGDTSPHVALAAFQGKKGVYGVGAMQGLRGEVLIWDGRVLISRGHATDGAASAVMDSDRATLLATAKVSRWREIDVPADMAQADFERFVKDQARTVGLALDKPFPFIVKGRVIDYAWHVVAGAATATAGGMMHAGGNAAHAKLHEFMGARIDSGQLLGFYSAAEMEGAITHPGEQFHVHIADSGFKFAGHVDRYGVGKGATLVLPER